MGQFVLKNIEMTLDPKSIRAAIKEVKKLQEDLGKALHELVRVLTDQGVEIAKIEISSLGAVDTSLLFESIEGVYNPETHVGIVMAAVSYAIYVEYGTGIVGAENPHPEPEKIGWDYDIHEHGEGGWWYPSPTGWYVPKDGVTNEEGWSLAWTKGMPARPFMYNTLKELEVEAEISGGRIIAEYIP